MSKANRVEIEHRRKSGRNQKKSHLTWQSNTNSGKREGKKPWK
jgi:hypothetical protein